MDKELKKTMENFEEECRKEKEDFCKENSSLDILDQARNFTIYDENATEEEIISEITGEEAENTIKFSDFTRFLFFVPFGLLGLLSCFFAFIIGIEIFDSKKVFIVLVISLYFIIYYTYKFVKSLKNK